MCYNSFVKSARSFRALPTMRPRHAFLLTPSNLCAFARLLREDLCTFVRRLHEESPHPTHLLSYHHIVRVSPLAATLMVFPVSVANKRLTVGLSPLAATLMKNTGEGARLLLTRSVNRNANGGFLSRATTTVRESDAAGPSTVGRPVPNCTDHSTLPHIYSRCAILPSPRSGDRPFLPPWRPI